MAEGFNIIKFPYFLEAELCLVESAFQINNKSTHYSQSLQVTVIAYLCYCKSLLVDVYASIWNFLKQLGWFLKMGTKIMFDPWAA